MDHSLPDSLLHHGPVTLHIGVHWDVVAGHVLLVFGRITAIGLAVLLGHLSAGALKLGIRHVDTKLLSYYADIDRGGR